MKFALSFGTDYGYYNNQSIGLTFIGTGNNYTGTLLIPVTMWSDKQRHLATFNLGASTSLTDRFTLRSKVRALVGREVSAHWNVESGSQSYFRFGDASVGFSYQLRPITDSTSLTMFADYNLLENIDGRIGVGKTASGGISVNIFSDPLLYTLSVAYAHIGNINNSRYHNIAGDFIMFSPNINLSLNDKVSLNGGASVAISMGDRGDTYMKEATAMVYYGISHKKAAGNG